MVYLEMLRLDADVLLRETNEFTKQERSVVARLLVRLAAVETRELYAPCGYASMWEYCLGELEMSDDAAARRLWAARKCREFPALFDALADGRIQLTAVHLLSTHLRADNVDELIAAATGRTKAELRDWLACRFPRPAVPTTFRPVGAVVGQGSLLAPAGPDAPPPPAGIPTDDSLQPSAANENADSHALARVPDPSTAPDALTPVVPLRNRARIEPLNAEQIKVQFTMSRAVLARMKEAMDLLGDRVARDDVAALFERLLDVALPVFKKQKFAATDHPRAPRTPHQKRPANARRIPAHVKRAVWKRDGGRCTFESATGRRCQCTRGLHFDHIIPVALGGEATVENIRLLCSKHNQLEAERRLGAEFMQQKRASRQAAREKAGMSLAPVAGSS